MGRWRAPAGGRGFPGGRATSDRFPRGSRGAAPAVLAGAVAFLLALACETGPGSSAAADEDGDGVPAGADLCPDTRSGARVDAGGCPLAALSPADSSGPSPSDSAGPFPGPGFGPGGLGGDTTRDAAHDTLPGPESVEDTAAAPAYTEMEVFYGTDRTPTGAADAASRYGPEPGDLHFGTVRVSIPLRHEAGRLEGPALACVDDSDPGEHIALVDLTPLDDDEWNARLAVALGASERDEILVYVHGYNTSFESAARRSAQLAFDISFRGVPAVYAWPSKGTLSGYPSDAETVVLSAPRLATFLRALADRAGPGKVHVVAHSLGNRLLTGALRRLMVDEAVPGVAGAAAEDPVGAAAAEEAGSVAEDPGGARLLGQVIMAAPDVNARIFAEQIVPEIRGIAERITLYASARDRALQMSRQFSDYPRAGQAGEDVVVLEGLDTVDASRAVTDLLGHGYFSENKRLVDDIFLLVRHELPPPERNLRRVPHGDLAYWAIP